MRVCWMLASGGCTTAQSRTPSPQHEATLPQIRTGHFHESWLMTDHKASGLNLPRRNGTVGGLLCEPQQIHHPCTQPSVRLYTWTTITERSFAGVEASDLRTSGARITVKLRFQCVDWRVSSAVNLTVQRTERTRGPAPKTGCKAMAQLRRFAWRQKVVDTRAM